MRHPQSWSHNSKLPPTSLTQTPPRGDMESFSNLNLDLNSQDTAWRTMWVNYSNLSALPSDKPPWISQVRRPSSDERYRFFCGTLTLSLRVGTCRAPILSVLAGMWIFSLSRALLGFRGCVAECFAVSMDRPWELMSYLSMNAHHRGSMHIPCHLACQLKYPPSHFGWLFILYWIFVGTHAPIHPEEKWAYSAAAQSHLISIQGEHISITRSSLPPGFHTLCRIVDNDTIQFFWHPK